MKRPFAVIGITYLTAQTVAAFLGSTAGYAMAAAFALLTMIYRLSFRKRDMVVTAVMITACIASLVSGIYTTIVIDPIRQLRGNTVYIEAVAAEMPTEKDGRYIYILKTESIDAPDVVQSVQLRLTTRTPLNLEYSDHFCGSVQIASSNYSYFTTQGTASSVYLNSNSVYYVTEGKGGILTPAIFMRKKILETVDRLFPAGSGTLLKAALMGDTTYLTARQTASFRAAGMSHFLAVSGFHLSIIAAALVWLMRKLHLNRKAAALAVCLCIWFYICMIGFPASALRAGIMLTLMQLGILVDRIHEPLNSLGFAVLIICLLNPYAALDPGLLMSFLSTLGLLTIGPKLSQVLLIKAKKIKNKVLKAVVTEATGTIVQASVAWIFTLPVAVLLNSSIPTYSVLANLLLIYPASLLIVLGVVCVLIGMLGTVGSVIAYPIMAVCWALEKLLDFGVRTISSLPGSQLVFSRTTVFVLVAAELAMLGMWYHSNKLNRKKRLNAAICLLLMASIFACAFWSQSIIKTKERLTVYDVDDGVCVVLEYGSDRIMIGAGGDSYGVTQAYYDIRSNGVIRLDALLLPQMNNEFAGAADKIIPLLSPKYVLLGDYGEASDAVNRAVLQNNSLTADIAGSTVNCGKLTAEDVSDQYGRLWIMAHSGSFSVLICPVDGDALDCPFSGANVAVIQGNTLANITQLDADILVVSSESDYTALLSARGLENVYCTGALGSFEIWKRNDKLYMGGAEQ